MFTDYMYELEEQNPIEVSALAASKNIKGLPRNAPKSAIERYFVNKVE
jgi:hypothetical protein